jgi:hypothetical protein
MDKSDDLAANAQVFFKSSATKSRKRLAAP